MTSETDSAQKPRSGQSHEAHPSDPQGESVALFKALADPTRLRMVGLMAAEPRCGQELASILRISPATVSHHLRVPRRAELLRVRRETPHTYFDIDLSRIRRSVRAALKPEAVVELAAGPDLSAEKRHVLRSFFDGKLLRAIPAQRRKKEIVFEEVLRRLPKRKSFGERELSRQIEKIHPDFCTIRREFIMGRYMERDAGVYRLTERGRAAIAEGS